MNSSLRKRHFFKSLTWNICGTSLSAVIAWLVLADLDLIVQLAAAEISIKLFLYYLHERFWFKMPAAGIKSEFRHFSKTFSWRLIASLTTFSLVTMLSGSLSLGIKISLLEIIFKMLPYFLHERLWFTSNFGIKTSEETIIKPVVEVPQY